MQIILYLQVDDLYENNVTVEKMLSFVTEGFDQALIPP